MFAAVKATYAQVGVLDVECGAHVCEAAQVLVVQQDVDGDPALVGRLHQITQQVHVCEHVHHQRDHLQPRRQEGRQQEDNVCQDTLT